MTSLLTIVTINYNSSDFIDNMLYTLKGLTYFNYKVLVCENGSNTREKQKIKKIIKKYKNTEIFFRQQQTPGSIGKAEALNILIDRINTPYGIIMDADAVFLKKDWDKILLDRFDDKIKIAGGVRGAVGYPTDFPDTYVTIFDTKVFKSLNIDMMPKKMTEGQDVGWEMYDKFTKAGYKAIGFELRNTRDCKKGPFNEVICKEYYIEGIDYIFAVHFCRGSTLGASKYKRAWKKYFYMIPILGKYFLRRKGKKEKQKWINICKEITDKQI